MNVDLRRFDGFVAQPEGDYRLIDAVLQQLHRRAVPEDVLSSSDARNPVCRATSKIA